MSQQAIFLQIEDQQTGAVAEVHKVASYNVDLTAGFCQAHVAAYASLKAVAEGKRAIAQRHVSVPGLPPEGTDPVPWLYERLRAQADDATRAHPAYVPSPFVGGDLVTV